MKTKIAMLTAALMLTAGSVYAVEIQGEVRNIDKPNSTITLNTTTRVPSTGPGVRIQVSKYALERNAEGINSLDELEIGDEVEVSAFNAGRYSWMANEIRETGDNEKTYTYRREVINTRSGERQVVREREVTVKESGPGMVRQEREVTITPVEEL